MRRHARNSLRRTGAHRHRPSPPDSAGAARPDGIARRAVPLEHAARQPRPGTGTVAAGVGSSHVRRRAALRRGVPGPRRQRPGQCASASRPGRSGRGETVSARRADRTPPAAHRSGPWASAALVTTFGPEEYGPGPFAGIEFRRRWSGASSRPVAAITPSPRNVPTTFSRNGPRRDPGTRPTPSERAQAASTRCCPPWPATPSRARCESNVAVSRRCRISTRFRTVRRRAVEACARASATATRGGAGWRPAPTAPASGSCGWPSATATARLEAAAESAIAIGSSSYRTRAMSFCGLLAIKLLTFRPASGTLTSMSIEADECR